MRSMSRTCLTHGQAGKACMAQSFLTPGLRLRAHVRTSDPVMPGGSDAPSSHGAPAPASTTCHRRVQQRRACSQEKGVWEETILIMLKCL